MTDRSCQAMRWAPYAAFAVFLATYVWRWSAPLWYDEILYPMAGSATLSWLDTYLLCNGDAWATVLYSYVAAVDLNRILIRLPQSVAMAFAGALCVRLARTTRSALIVFVFWLLYLPVFHYGAEGRQFGMLTAATAIMAAGIVQQRFALTVAAAAVMAATSPYGALCGSIGIVLGHPNLPLRRRLLASLPFVGLLLWMGEVFPRMPQLYPDDLRYLILPETRPDYRFSVKQKAIEWLVGSESPPLFAALAASWLVIAILSLQSPLLRVAATTTLAQLAVMIVKDRVMHVWNMFTWVPLWALLLEEAARKHNVARHAAAAIALVSLANAVVFAGFYVYRGPRPIVGIDTDAWLEIVAHLPPETNVVLRRSGGSLATFLPALRHLDRATLYTAPSRLHLSAEVEAGIQQWLRDDQTLVPLETVDPQLFGRWAVFVWNLLDHNPCVVHDNPCVEHALLDIQPIATATLPGLPATATVHPLRGGSIVEWEATAAEVLAFIAQQNTYLEYLRATEAN